MGGGVEEVGGGVEEVGGGVEEVGGGVERRWGRGREEGCILGLLFAVMFIV